MNSDAGPLRLPAELSHPPAEWSVCPFWFWNDALDEAEIVRQIGDFAEHGVQAFVIHPRVGLPPALAWMSDELLRFYRVALDEARRRGMRVALYDEGMYPSGSSCGQVVASNPDFACRCLARRELDGDAPPALEPGEDLVAVVERANGQRLVVVDRKAGSVIRGLHYLGEGPAEETPPAADLLNPAAVAAFVRLVYDRFYDALQPYFGNTIFAIFTDEPSLLGRRPPPDVRPGTRGILEPVQRILGYDFTPHLPALWYDDEPEAPRYREEYSRALEKRLEETYYRQLSDWCAAHGVALAGHPAKGDDLGVLRLFHIPGQDLVWRWVLPDHPSALEGPESTQAKCSASAMLHAGRRRNGNECCGAYGSEMTWEEMQWLARWCFVRGVNLLYPHAFYYSMRGPRRDERPPDVGPNSPWWPRYREYADACSRLSWLNTDAEQVCDLAILGRAEWLPWRSAKWCYERQIDFNYIEERDLLDRATITPDGIRIAGLCYRVLLSEHAPEEAVAAALRPFEQAGRWLRFPGEARCVELQSQVDALTHPRVRVEPAVAALRVRHLRKCGFDVVLVFNEAHMPVSVKVHLPGSGPRFGFDAVTAQVTALEPEAPLALAGHELKVVLAPPVRPGSGCDDGVSCHASVI